eukprot:853889-Amphidinium_carterae.1
MRIKRRQTPETVNPGTKKRTKLKNKYSRVCQGLFCLENEVEVLVLFEKHFPVQQVFPSCLRQRSRDSQTCATDTTHRTSSGRGITACERWVLSCAVLAKNIAGFATLDEYGVAQWLETSPLSVRSHGSSGLQPYANAGGESSGAESSGEEALLTDCQNPARFPHVSGTSRGIRSIVSKVAVELPEPQLPPVSSYVLRHLEVSVSTIKSGSPIFRLHLVLQWLMHPQIDKASAKRKQTE